MINMCYEVLDHILTICFIYENNEYRQAIGMLVRAKVLGWINLVLV